MKKYVAKIGALLTVAAFAQAVLLTTSAGAYPVPKPCNVPNVVGMQLSKAENAITKKNCKVGSITTQTSQKPKDHVIAQSPTSGSGPTVNLTVSLGQPKPGAKCKVPNVVGKSLAKAESALVKANCGVGTVTQKKSKKAKGRVISQSPSSGTSGAVGKKVDLTVSKGKKKK